MSVERTATGRKKGSLAPVSVVVLPATVVVTVLVTVRVVSVYVDVTAATAAAATPATTCPSRPALNVELAYQRTAEIGFAGTLYPVVSNGSWQLL